LATGTLPRAGTTYLTGGVAYYNIYRSRDDKAFTVACNEPYFYANLCELLSLPELTDRQYVDAEGQRANHARFQERFATRYHSEWMALSRERDLPLEPVRTLDEVVSDRELTRRAAFVTLSHREMGDVVQVAPSVRLSATPASVRELAHAPGEDTDAVLRSAGYDDAAIAALRATNVVGG